MSQDKNSKAGGAGRSGRKSSGSISAATIESAIYMKEQRQRYLDDLNNRASNAVTSYRRAYNAMTNAQRRFDEANDPYNKRLYANSLKKSRNQLGNASEKLRTVVTEDANFRGIKPDLNFNRFIK